MHRYSEKFYVRTKRATLHSAEVVVPLLMDLLQPKSVIDVGCAAGTWLSVFQRFGVADIFGIDTGLAKREIMEIPQDVFRPLDLDKPFRLERTFDLVTSLEVAEHLPASSAEAFVDSLTRLGPVILFSAAIPFQGGSNHLNEQWPEYWATFFAERGYRAIDCLRKELWQNPLVSWWYAQNLILYVRRDSLAADSRLKLECGCDGLGPPPALIHPTRYLATADLRSVPLRRLLRALPGALVSGAKRTFKDQTIHW